MRLFDLRRGVAGLSLAAALTVQPAAAPRAAVFGAETFTLDNGVQVVVVPNHRAPVVIHMVWYRVGAADETPGRSGIAHFLEHLMFKGTEAHPDGEFSRIVARNGGSENAFTTQDYTGYYQTVARDRLETVMALEADRMTHLRLVADVVEPERQVVLEERRMRTDNNPAALLNERTEATLFPNHPYGRPIIGWANEVRDLSREAILDFYHRWYTPANAVLVVGGDITAAALKPLAERTYGRVPASPPPHRARPAEPLHGAAQRVELRDPKVRQPSWGRTYLAPSHGSGAHAEVYALEVLAEILGGGSSSRLYREMVVEHPLAVSAGASYDGDALGPGTFGLWGSPRPGTSMDALEQAFEARIARLLADGVSAEEVTWAKRRLRTDAVFARDSLTTGPQVLGTALMTGRTVAEVEAWPDRIAAVSVAAVNAAARRVFDAGRSVTSRLLPEDGITAGGTEG